MIPGFFALAVMTIQFGVAHGGGKKNPKIPRGKNEKGDRGKEKPEEKEIPHLGNTLINTDYRHLNSSSAPNSTTGGKPTKPWLATDPPELIRASKISRRMWNTETRKIVKVNDPEFFSALLEPRSNAFIGFRWDGLAAGNMVLGNSTNVTVAENETRSDPIEKRDVGEPVPSSSANLGIFMVTGVLVAVCIVGLLVIFCVARANGQRDYAIGNRRAQRLQQQQQAAQTAAGWRRSQEHLDEPGLGVVEERNLGGSPALAMTRMESDVTDV